PPHLCTFPINKDKDNLIFFYQHSFMYPRSLSTWSLFPLAPGEVICAIGWRNSQDFLHIVGQYIKKLTQEVKSLATTSIIFPPFLLKKQPNSHEKYNIPYFDSLQFQDNPGPLSCSPHLTFNINGFFKPPMLIKKTSWSILLLPGNLNQFKKMEGFTNFSTVSLGDISGSEAQDDVTQCETCKKEEKMKSQVVESVSGNDGVGVVGRFLCRQDPRRVSDTQSGGGVTICDDSSALPLHGVTWRTLNAPPTQLGPTAPGAK
ncbi:hypothetical protein VP01_1014g1, partial [Puccinia sorghi]